MTRNRLCAVIAAAAFYAVAASRTGDPARCGCARSQESTADRHAGLCGLPRCRRQQRLARESEPRRTGGRLYHPPTHPLQGGDSRQCDDAGDDGDAFACRHDCAGRLLLAAEAQGPGIQGHRRSSRPARPSGAAAMPTRASRRAQPATRPTAQASRRTIREYRASTPTTRMPSSRPSRPVRVAPTLPGRTSTAPSCTRSLRS